MTKHVEYTTATFNRRICSVSFCYHVLSLKLLATILEWFWWRYQWLFILLPRLHCISLRSVFYFVRFFRLPETALVGSRIPSLKISPLHIAVDHENLFPDCDVTQSSGDVRRHSSRVARFNALVSGWSPLIALQILYTAFDWHNSFMLSQKSHIVSSPTRCRTNFNQARSQVLGLGRSRCILKGQDFCYYQYALIKHYLGATKFGGRLAPNAWFQRSWFLSLFLRGVSCAEVCMRVTLLLINYRSSSCEGHPSPPARGFEPAPDSSRGMEKFAQDIQYRVHCSAPCAAVASFATWLSHDGITSLSHDCVTSLSHDGVTWLSHDGVTWLSHDGVTLLSHGGVYLSAARRSRNRVVLRFLYKMCLFLFQYKYGASLKAKLPPYFSVA